CPGCRLLLSNEGGHGVFGHSHQWQQMCRAVLATNMKRGREHETGTYRLCLDPLILPVVHFPIICYTVQDADLQITTEGDARGSPGGLPVSSPIPQPLQPARLHA